MTRALPYQLTDRLFVLGHSLFLTYLVKGDPCTLIDLGVSGTFPLIERQLRQLGLGAGDIGNLVVQHAHWDHVCSLPYLKRLFPRAVVLGSAKAREVLAKPKIVDQFRLNDERYCTKLKCEGFFSQLPAFLVYDTIPVDRVMEDNESVSLGGIEYCFLLTPGHSPCSMSVYLPSEKVAIISDAVGAYMPHSDEVLPLFFQGVKLTLDSLEKLKALDADIVGTGHDLDMIYIGKENVAHYYRRVREEIMKLVTEIKRRAASGADEEELSDILFRASHKGFLAAIYTPDYLRDVSPYMLKAIYKE